MLVACMDESFSRILTDQEAWFLKAGATAIDGIKITLQSPRERQLWHTERA